MAARVNEIHVTDMEFKHEVLESEDTVLVDFCADWLAQCRQIPGIVQKLSTALRGKLKVVRVNVNECYRTAEEYGIRAFPTFLLFKNGQLINRLAGGFPEDEMLGRLKVMIQTS